MLMSPMLLALLCLAMLVGLFGSGYVGYGCLEKGAVLWPDFLGFCLLSRLLTAAAMAADTDPGKSSLSG